MRPGIVAVEHGADLANERVRLRLALTVAVLALEQVGDRVEPDAVDTHVQPEPHDVEHLLANGGVLEVQVGLVREEPVEEELSPHRIEGPVGFLGVDEDDADVRVLLVGVAPDVVVAVRPLRVRPGLLEPVVRVGGVVERVVDDDAHVALVGATNEFAELLDRAELGQDGAEIRDVVSAVAKRRLVDRRKPQGVDAQPLQVVET